MKQVETCPLCKSEDITVGEPKDRFLRSIHPKRLDLYSITEVRISCPTCGFSGTTAVNSASEQRFISAN